MNKTQIHRRNCPVRDRLLVEKTIPRSWKSRRDDMMKRIIKQIPIGLKARNNSARWQRLGGTK
ncbi:MAG: hypothetical protein LBU83_04515 [Bacteroidales bacterium]|nr:hypothetical protein [Bacteroidales bacterium]